MGEPAPTHARQAADLLVKSPAPAVDPLVPLKGGFERLATRCTEAFGDLASERMELAFRDIASRPIGEAQAGCAETSVVGAFQTPDKGTRILVGADTALVDAALEAVFGSDGSEPTIGGRAVTRIGLRLAGTIFQQVVDELRPAFGAKAPSLQLDKVETADKLPAPKRRDELSVVATFGLSTLGRVGEMFVILPQSALQGVHLGSASAAAGGAAQGTGDTVWSKRIEQEVQRTEVMLHAVLDERELTLGEIAELRIGQVLPLKATPRSNVKVVCNDQTMFWCELGQTEGVYTLRIREFPDEEQELIDAITSG